MSKWWRSQPKAKPGMVSNRNLISRLPKKQAATSRLLLTLIVRAGDDFKFPGNRVHDAKQD